MTDAGDTRMIGGAGIAVPEWGFWARRPTIELRTAVAMVHNFRGNDETLKALQQADEDRWEAFHDDLRTARKWLGFDPLLVPAKGGQPPLDRNGQNKCDVVLEHFVEWVRRDRRLSANPPDAFLALNPPLPTGLKSASEIRGDEASSTGPSTSSAGDGEGPQTLGEASVRGSLTLGLLAMYVRDLAINKKSPPLSLLIGNGKRINFSELAKAIEEFAGLRTDQPTPNANSRHGASVVTLRKELALAANLFADTFDSTDDRNAR